MLFVKFDLKFGVIVEFPIPGEYVIFNMLYGAEVNGVVLNDFELVLEATRCHLIIMSFISLIFISKMSKWFDRLRKDGFDIDEIGFLNLGKSSNNWGLYGKGSYGTILKRGDKILKIQKYMNTPENLKEFQQEIRIQKMVYNCTKNYRSLTPKVFSYGKNWVLMKSAPGLTITQWYNVDRKGVFQKAMRAYIKALQKIHRKCGIGHFDAHGSNAVYDHMTGAIKIIDWGYAAPVSQNNLTREGMLKKYKETLANRLGPRWERDHANWTKKMKTNVIGQYAIEIIPYNARFKNLKPRNNIVDFMSLILSNANNFPTPAPMTRQEFLKSLFTPTPSPKYNSANK